MRVAFFGGLFPKEFEQEILANTIGSPQTAANVLQWNIVKGLDANTAEPTTLLNALFIGAYPKRYRKLRILGGSFNHSEQAAHVDYQLPFLNVPGWKHISKLGAFRRKIRQVARDPEFSVFMGYSMTLSVVLGLVYAKKRNPASTTCLVVPDLPEYMNLGKRKSRNALKRLSNRILYDNIKKLDSFVVLTAYMPERLGVADKPFVVVEGIVNPRPCSVKKQDPSAPRQIVYTGSLNEKYGGKALVEAFHRLEFRDAELVICGSGDTTDYIKTVAREDSRIRYLGVVPHSEIRAIQERAYLLVNPRDSREEYTKFSFPSKTMEYMDAGRPVLMYPLKGVPEEYDPYLMYVDPEREDALYYALKEALELPVEQINELGKKAKLFVDTQKNCAAQGAKMMELFRKLLENP